MPLLRELRLRGVPSAAIPTLLTYLPNLITLDTEFLGSGIYRPSNKPLPHLHNLTVRTSSMDSMGPHRLWMWIRQLLPYPSMESFTLNAFSVQGHTIIPRNFILDLTATHKTTLKEFMVNMTLLTLEDVRYLCTMLPGLEHLACSVASPHVVRISNSDPAGYLQFNCHVECDKTGDKRCSEFMFPSIACYMDSGDVADSKVG